MTDPITITNQAALEQGQRVAREREKELPPGPWSYCPNWFDDWGVVRDANNQSVANTCPSGLAKEFSNDHPVFDAVRKAGPPKARAVAELLIAAERRYRGEVSPAEQALRVELRRYVNGYGLWINDKWVYGNPESQVGVNYANCVAHILVRRMRECGIDATYKFACEPTFPPEIPPHIQYLRQLPAAKAGQSIEEAAADEIRRLREEKNYHFDQVQRACVNMNKEALKVASLTAERDALLSQLPDGMKHCTIQVKECENGHARLTATNWIDHGCHWCELAALAERESKMRDVLTALRNYHAAAEHRESMRHVKAEHAEYVKEIDAALSPAPSPPGPSWLDKPVTVSQTERDRDTLDARITEVESLRSEWMASTHLNNQSRFDAYRDACKELIEDLIAGYRARDAENATLRQQLTEADKLKTIVRERTHREQGCLCDRCVEDEYQTAEVVGKLRREAEAAKGAALFASEAHKGQTRKYNGRPYIEHPMRVAHAALLQDAPPHVVAAAWLHDVIEDCGTTADCLSAKFGYDVAALVVELTNPSKGLRLPRAQRKAMDRDHIAKASYWAKVLKLLDRIDNISEMRGCGDDFLVLYAKESRLLADAIEATDERLHALKDVLELAIADSLATPSPERPAP